MVASLICSIEAVLQEAPKIHVITHSLRKQLKVLFQFKLHCCLYSDGPCRASDLLNRSVLLSPLVWLLALCEDNELSVCSLHFLPQSSLGPHPNTNLTSLPLPPTTSSKLSIKDKINEKVKKYVIQKTRDKTYRQKFCICVYTETWKSCHFMPSHQNKATFLSVCVFVCVSFRRSNLSLIMTVHWSGSCWRELWG